MCNDEVQRTNMYHTSIRTSSGAFVCMGCHILGYSFLCNLDAYSILSWNYLFYVILLMFCECWEHKLHGCYGCGIAPSCRIMFKRSWLSWPCHYSWSHASPEWVRREEICDSNLDCILKVFYESFRIEFWLCSKSFKLCLGLMFVLRDFEGNLWCTFKKMNRILYMLIGLKLACRVILRCDVVLTSALAFCFGLGSLWWRMVFHSY